MYEVPRTLKKGRPKWSVSDSEANMVWYVWARKEKAWERG